MRPFYSGIASLLLFWTQATLWIGKNGMRDYLRLKKEVEQQQLLNRQLEQCNTQLSSEIVALAEGLEAIEERARYELGMVKPEEQFLRFPAKKVDA